MVLPDGTCEFKTGNASDVGQEETTKEVRVDGGEPWATVLNVGYVDTEFDWSFARAKEHESDCGEDDLGVGRSLSAQTDAHFPVK